MTSILLIGSGGREQAIAQACVKSQQIEKLFFTGINPEISKIAQNVELDIKDHSQVVDFCKKNDILTVIVGPEDPLVNGIADDLEGAGIRSLADLKNFTNRQENEERGHGLTLGGNEYRRAEIDAVSLEKNKICKRSIKVFGPSKKAAQIEGSKAFMKDLCKKYNIPTAKYESFTKNKEAQAIAFLDEVENSSGKFVVKTSGLAAGKGVAICESKNEAKDEIRELFSGKFGSAGDEIIIEEFLEGEEVSLFAISNGDRAIMLDTAGDHKRALNHDQGLNTGGMGSYSPSPFLVGDDLTNAKEVFVDRFVNAMKAEGCEYKGVIFAGLIMTQEGAKLLEYNCRFGDPETQAVLARLDDDFYNVIDFVTNKDSNVEEIKFCKTRKAVNIVVSAKGYPRTYEKGFVVCSQDDIRDLEEGQFISAGLKLKGDKCIANGGRLLSICTKEDDFQTAINNAYEVIDKLFKNNKNLHYRTDIGKKVVGFCG